MNFLDQILGRPSEKQLAKIAEEVAGRSRHAIWKRVNRRLEVMQPREAKGYIRARSAVILEREVEQLVDQKRLTTSVHRHQVFEWASDAVIQMIEAQARIAFSQTAKPRQVA